MKKLHFDMSSANECVSEIPDVVTPLTAFAAQTEERRQAALACKPSAHTVTLKLPESLLEEIKQLARHRDMPFQALIKDLLVEKLAEEH